MLWLHPRCVQSPAESYTCDTLIERIGEIDNGYIWDSLPEDTSSSHRKTPCNCRRHFAGNSAWGKFFGGGLNCYVARNYVLITNVVSTIYYLHIVFTVKSFAENTSFSQLMKQHDCTTKLHFPSLSLVKQEPKKNASNDPNDPKVFWMRTQRERNNYKSGQYIQLMVFSQDCVHNMYALSVQKHSCDLLISKYRFYFL